MKGETLIKLWLEQGGYAMVIQHNMSAMNANRQLGLTTRHIAKSSEKLSSGYKINRAADDAAGLSISEKMRKQIRGLNQASENIEDGVSLCQVADGALNETVSILQRMRELAVQSANGTNSVSDREAIDMEITQLKIEVDRIAKTTKFNDAVYPLNTPVTYSKVVTEVIGPPGGSLTGGLLHEKTITFQTNRPCTYEGTRYNLGDTITITGLTTNEIEVWVFQGATTNSLSAMDRWFNSNKCDDNNMKALRISDLVTDEQNRLYYVNASNIKMYAIYDVNTKDTDPLAFGPILPSGFRFMTIDDLGTSQTPPVIQTQTEIKRYLSLNEATSIHAGASSSQTNKIQVPVVNATCEGLGIADLTVINAERRLNVDDDTATAEENTTKAMLMLDKAIATASSYRSAFGAVQNRLEHAQRIDDNTAENTQAAESQIRDTDIAGEMVQYSNVSILMQAGQSMLAQANQSKQGVLSLVA